VDNFLKKTRVNLEENPNMAIVAYDSEIKRSFQLKGTVDLETRGERYAIAEEMARAKNRLAKVAVVFHVKEIFDNSPGPSAGNKLA
jgi:predicted pyridoxine 5'-phosphate oxidase superfamily flavin-nucleotide-binding protein